jgi:hypothetical protein
VKNFPGLLSMSLWGKKKERMTQNCFDHTHTTASKITMCVSLLDVRMAGSSLPVRDFEANCLVRFRREQDVLVSLVRCLDPLLIRRHESVSWL